jgi:hypothetical protein
MKNSEANNDNSPVNDYESHRASTIINHYDNNSIDRIRISS